MKKEALRVTSTIPVAPTTLYFAWIDSDHHSAMTGATAKIDSVVGGKYSACGGYVTGKLVILDLGRRIVMSWRTADFPREAPDSRVEVHFETLGASTRLLILHTEIPEGQSEKYKALWNDTYVQPMRTYFSKFLPDPRNPPIRRPPPMEGQDEQAAESKPEASPRRKEASPAKGAPAPKPSAKTVASEASHAQPAKSGAKPQPKEASASAPKKPTTDKPPVKKAPTKAAKPTSKKPAPKKPEPKKPAPKKAAVTKPITKKPAPKKTAGKKPAPKSPASKKPAPKKPAPKKAAPKKAAKKAKR